VHRPLRCTRLVLHRLDALRVERTRRETKVGELDVASTIDKEVLRSGHRGVLQRGGTMAGESLVVSLTSGLRSRWM
jgi:hypothetical protein